MTPDDTAESGKSPRFPSTEADAHLRSPFPLSEEARDAYRRDGFVLLRRVLDPDVVAAARPHLIAALQRHWPAQERSAEERDDAYSRAFVQISKVGLETVDERAFPHEWRIVRVAAELIGVRGVRIHMADW